MIKKTLFIFMTLLLMLMLQFSVFAYGSDSSNSNTNDNAFQAAIILQEIVGLRDGTSNYVLADAAWLLSQSGTEAEPSVPPKEHHDPDEGEWDIIL